MGMVAHTCILSTWELRQGDSIFEARLGNVMSLCLRRDS